LQVVHNLHREVLRLSLEERAEIINVRLTMERQDAVRAACLDYP
jgi:hypothetical protein